MRGGGGREEKEELTLLKLAMGRSSLPKSNWLKMSEMSWGLACRPNASSRAYKVSELSKDSRNSRSKD